MTRSLPRLLTLLALAVLASAFVAASCDEHKKPDAEPHPNPPSPTTGLHDGDPGAGKTVFEKKKPADFGPRAPAIFVLSGLQGYTEPCGCTLDVMLGGIDRITGYVDAARKLYPATGVVHAGDMFFEDREVDEHEIPQEKARVDVVVTGLKRLGVAASVPGAADFALGATYYQAEAAAAGVTPVAANLSIGGKRLPASKTVEVGGQRVAYVGVVDPAKFEGVDGVVASGPDEALGRALAHVDAPTVILLSYGDLPFTKQRLAKHGGLDFGVVGYHPRETDQVDQAGSGFTLEPYDQGRYLGVLKLYHPDASASFVNARTGSKGELAKIEHQIEHVNKSIGRMPPATPGKEPPILLNLRRRLASLKDRREKIRHGGIHVPEDKAAFAWRTVAMEPGYPVDPTVSRARKDYNASLEALSKKVDRPLIPPEKGKPAYVGNAECATCHKSEVAFWKHTAHARAFQTLVDRHKAYDTKCVSCHVVGYDQPGGSVLGKWEYDAKVPRDGGKPLEVHKDLRDVGCEACHGPGSQHIVGPVGPDGKPQHILRKPGESRCNTCHVMEHSPRFDFDVYVEQITGKGHPRSSKP